MSHSNEMITRYFLLQNKADALQNRPELFDDPKKEYALLQDEIASLKTDLQARDALLKARGLEKDTAWQNASFEEIARYRQEVSFYHFWYWEYQRRNPEYQAEYEKGPVTAFRPDHFLCDPAVGQTSTEILQSICDGTFERREPMPNFWFRQSGKERNHIEWSWVNDKWKEHGVEKKQTKISITLDPDLDHDVALEHVKDILSWGRENKERVSSLFEKSYGGKGVLEYMDNIAYMAKRKGISTSEAASEINRRIPSWEKEWIELSSTKTITDLQFQKPISNGKDSYEEKKRALGIWIYDYQKEKGSNVETARRALQRRFGLDPIEDKENWHRLMRHAKNCIEQCEVLPFSEGCY